MPRLAWQSFAFLTILGMTALAPASNWPQWRGPTGDAVSTDKDMPVKWDGESGIVWKCPLPGPGASTPAVWNDAVFLTAMAGEKLHILRINKADGKIVWDKEIGTGTMRRGSPKRSEHTFHNLHNMASPSPVTDGDVVVWHFGNGDLIATDFNGKQLWARNLQKDHGNYSIWWGHANSPVVYKDLVISVCMQDSLDNVAGVKDPATSYLVAHDKRTGDEKWKVMRMTGVKAEDCDSYTTPLFHEVNGKIEMIIVGANQVDGYDPATGKQLWVLTGIKGSRTITGPTLAHNMLFTTEGKRGALLGIRLGGTGKLGKETIAWSEPQSTPDTPCPVVWGDLLFTVSDDGIVQCLDAKTGKVHWKERLQGDFKASLIAADGKIYCLNRAGRCVVLAAKPMFEKLGDNRIEDDTVASPAIADSRLYIRGHKFLYAIGAK